MTCIYFPSIRAYADTAASIKRGSSAQVCASFERDALGYHCYYGAVRRVKFTVTQPRDWNDPVVEYTELHHIADGGFAYNVAPEHRFGAQAE